MSKSKINRKHLLRNEGKYTVIDFFCGAGGFSEGFRQAGFKILKGYDYWKPAVETFNFNFNLNNSASNILEFANVEKIHEIPDSDIIIGSPPCVSFSNSNKSGNADKSLGIKLIKIFLKIIVVKKYKKNSKLKGWFMENVPNSRKHLPDSFSFKDLELSDWSIKMGLKPDELAIDISNNSIILNSADFESFQSRNRIITGEIFYKNKNKFPEILKTEKRSYKHDNSLQNLFSNFPNPYSNIDNLNFIKDPQYSLKIPKENLTDHFYDTGVYMIEWEKAKFLKTNHPYMGKMSFPENLEKPSRTITATQTPHSRESILYKCELNRKGDGEYRTPTLREAAILMGFPISYQFLGGESAKWRLVGNAVCCSLSRMLANSVLKVLKQKIKNQFNFIANPWIENIPNLNTFRIKKFNNPPIRKIGSRFRMHPFKDGNITVTLSNYCIKSNSKHSGKWFSSIQYGNGEGFPMQTINDGFYIKLNPTIKTLEKGRDFLKIINNGFSVKIASGKKMQTLYEKNLNQGGLSNPTELVNDLTKIIQNLKINEKYVSNKEVNIFKYKEKIPASQIFALYAINKIVTIANSKNDENH